MITTDTARAFDPARHVVTYASPLPQLTVEYVRTHRVTATYNEATFIVTSMDRLSPEQIEALVDTGALNLGQGHRVEAELVKTVVAAPQTQEVSTGKICREVTPVDRYGAPYLPIKKAYYQYTVIRECDTSGWCFPDDVAHIVR